MSVWKSVVSDIKNMSKQDIQYMNTSPKLKTLFEGFHFQCYKALPPWILYCNQWQEQEHIGNILLERKDRLSQRCTGTVNVYTICQWIINSEWTPGCIFNPRNRPGSVRIMISCRSSSFTPTSTHDGALFCPAWSLGICWSTERKILNNWGPQLQVESLTMHSGDLAVL